MSPTDYLDNWQDDDSFIETDYTSKNILKKKEVLKNYTALLDDEKSNNTVFERGWTMDSSLKLIGIPRLRQIRVRTGQLTIIYVMIFFVDCT